MGVHGLPRSTGQGSATDQLVQMGSKAGEKEKDPTLNLGYTSVDLYKGVEKVGLL